MWEGSNTDGPAYPALACAVLLMFATQHFLHISKVEPHFASPLRIAILPFQAPVCQMVYPPILNFEIFPDGLCLRATCCCCCCCAHSWIFSISSVKECPSHIIHSLLRSQNFLSSHFVQDTPCHWYTPRVIGTLPVPGVFLIYCLHWHTASTALSWNIIVFWTSGGDVGTQRQSNVFI